MSTKNPTADQIIASGSASHAYEYSLDHPESVDAMQQVIIDSGDTDTLALFAADVSGVDVPALQQVVIDSQNAWSCYLFARKVSGADIPALQQVVLDHGMRNALLWFANNIPGADLDALMDRLSAIGAHEDVAEFRERQRRRDLYAAFTS